MNTIDSLLMNELNPSQKEAVETTEGALLILAGAGTGKTKALTSRIAYIIEQKIASPHQILAVTFTNKAAKEMLERVEKYVSASGMWIGTFHSICAKILRSNAERIGLYTNFNILDQDDSTKLLKGIMESKGIDIKKYPPKFILNVIQSWKDKCISYLDAKPVKNRPNEEIAAKVYEEYQLKLRATNNMDFGDLILYVVQLFQIHPDVLETYQDRFLYIHVDEYQDTNIAQYMFVRMLAEKHKNICVVGDDDQSIYGWRGAEVDNILNFHNYIPGAKVIKLEQNYRSTQNILSAASSIISNNSERLGKSLWSAGDLGEKIYLTKLYNDLEEADFYGKVIKHLSFNGVSFSSIAFLVRASFQTRAIEESLVRHGIPYKVIGGLKFYERLEIKDAIAYIRATMNPNDDLAFERIINVPRRGIGDNTIKQIHNFGMLNKLSFFQSICEMLKNDILPKRASDPLTKLVAQFISWQEDSKNMPHYELVEKILTDSGYVGMWKEDKNKDSSARLDNLKEFYRALQEFDSMENFLEHVSLVSTNDDEILGNHVSIMTMHGSKGLEWEVVMLPGWEEGLFPSLRDGDSERDLQEERRLAYVALTRARKKIFISSVGRRRIYNTFQDSIPSRFITELPQQICTILTLNSLYTPEVFTKGLEVKKPSVLESSSSKVTDSDGNIKLGTRVFHVKFGYGKVMSMSDDSAYVYFDHAGLKNVKTSFLERH